MASAIGVLFLVSAVVGQGLDAVTLAMMDKNRDGFLDRSEFPGMDQLPDEQWAQIKNRMDLNKDGRISLQEFKEYISQEKEKEVWYTYTRKRNKINMIKAKAKEFQAKLPQKTVP